MIKTEILSQVLWNHAGCLNMTNQGNWLLEHDDKLLQHDSKKGNITLLLFYVAFKNRKIFFTLELRSKYFRNG